MKNETKPIYCPKCNTQCGHFPEETVGLLGLILKLFGQNKDKSFEYCKIKCPQCQVRLIVCGETKIVFTVKAI